MPWTTLLCSWSKSQKAWKWADTVKTTHSHSHFNYVGHGYNYGRTTQIHWRPWYVGSQSVVLISFPNLFHWLWRLSIHLFGTGLSPPCKLHRFRWLSDPLIKGKRDKKKFFLYKLYEIYIFRRLGFPIHIDVRWRSAIFILTFALWNWTKTAFCRRGYTWSILRQPFGCKVCCCNIMYCV